MGYAKLIWIYEDGIRGFSRSEESLAKIGEAVLKVCFDGERVAAVEGHSNCVNSCDEVHSTDERLFLWARNCLRPISRLNKEGMATAERLISASRQECGGEEQNVAAAKFWKLLTSRIDDAGPFGNRLLFYLPNSPMTAFLWGIIGGPTTLEDLQMALLDNNQKTRSHARDFLYGYLSDYKKIFERLGPKISENCNHLNEIAGIIINICNDKTAQDDRSEILPSLATMVLDLLDSSGAGKETDTILSLKRIAKK